MSVCINYKSEDGTFNSEKSYIFAYDEGDMINCATANCLMLKDFVGSHIQWNVDGEIDWRDPVTCDCLGVHPHYPKYNFKVCSFCRKVSQ